MSVLLLPLLSNYKYSGDSSNKSVKLYFSIAG